MELNKFGELVSNACPKCGRPVEALWVACPVCGYRLRTRKKNSAGDKVHTINNTNPILPEKTDRAKSFNKARLWSYTALSFFIILVPSVYMIHVGNTATLEPPFLFLTLFLWVFVVWALNSAAVLCSLDVDEVWYKITGVILAGIAVWASVTSCQVLLISVVLAAIPYISMKFK